MIKGCEKQPLIILYRRKSIPLNFPEKIKRKYIRHTGDVIQYGLYSSVKGWSLDVVLAGNSIDQQLGISLFW
jgi:hypothetical protein